MFKKAMELSKNLEVHDLNNTTGNPSSTIAEAKVPKIDGFGKKKSTKLNNLKKKFYKQ